MNSIVEAVFHHAQQQPERPAIFFEEQTISYGQLSANVEQFAYALAASGIQSGDRIALFLDNCPTFVIAYLGIQLAGGVVVLINTQYRQVELQHILTDAGVRLCVTSMAGREELLQLAAPMLTTLIIVQEVSSECAVSNAPDTNKLPDVMSETLVEQNMNMLSYADFVARGSDDAGLRSQLPLTMPEADAAAVIGYTSGTTGQAKGALLLQRNLIANIAAVTTAWHWTDNDRLLLTLPLFHVHGLMVGIHGTLFKGASVHLKRKFDATDVLSTLQQDASISLFFGVPTMYIRLLAEVERQGVQPRQEVSAGRAVSNIPDSRKLPALRLFVSGSAPLSSQVFAEFEHIFGQPILERYGMTETLMNLTNPYEGERRAGTVGRPFPGQEARVVAVRSRQPLPAGEIGEIEVRGPHVFAGYWNRPDATAEAFSADSWFKTGDLGWYSDDGYYTITGRARELIISGGYNIYPREIEDVLALHPAVAEVAVIGISEPEMGEQVVAIVVAQEGYTPNVADIVAFCRERLASYKKPRQIVFVTELPRNALGKIQKHLLVKQLQEGSC